MAVRQLKYRGWCEMCSKFIVLVTERNLFYGKNGLEASCHNHSCYTGVLINQFTGLLDKQGKEIYEGDLIEWGENTRRMEKVRFFKGYFSCDRREVKNNPIPIMLLSKIEVIGNIYEHKHLLDGK